MIGSEQAHSSDEVAHWILFRLKHETRTFELSEQRGPNFQDLPATLSFRMGDERGLIGWVGARARSIWIADVSQEPRWMAFEPWTRSAYLTPIALSEEVLGVFLVASGQRDGLDARHRALADAFALERARGWSTQHSGIVPRNPGVELSALSQRERDVVLALSRGMRLTDIARLLGISNHTARNHLKHVFRKLGVHSQVELLSILGRRAG